MSSLAFVYFASSVAGATFFGKTVHCAPHFAVFTTGSCSRRVCYSGVHGSLLAVRCFLSLSGLNTRVYPPSPQLPERADMHDCRVDHINCRHVWHLGHVLFLGHISHLRWAASSAEIPQDHC